MRPSTASASSISLAAQTALSNLSLMMAQFDEGHAAIREQAKVAPPGFYGDGQPLTINLNVKLLIMSSALVLHTHLARRLEYERREAGRHARISGLEPVGADRAREGGGDHQALRVMQEAVASSTANSLNLAAVVVRTIEVRTSPKPPCPDPSPTPSLSHIVLQDDLPRGLFQSAHLLLAAIQTRDRAIELTMTGGNKKKNRLVVAAHQPLWPRRVPLRGARARARLLLRFGHLRLLFLDDDVLFNLGGGIGIGGGGDKAV